jgi:riboflavin kinase
MSAETRESVPPAAPPLKRGSDTLPAGSGVHFPVRIRGEVVKGFGRGSKELGCPTANIPLESNKDAVEVLPVGVYYGLVQIDQPGSPVYNMAMSIGWNPYYKNDKKTVEVHVIHEFAEDFYGAQLRALALGYIRPECDFDGLESLITAINDDIAFAVEEMGRPENNGLKEDPFFASGE